MSATPTTVAKHDVISFSTKCEGEHNSNVDFYVLDMDKRYSDVNDDDESHGLKPIAEEHAVEVRLRRKLDLLLFPVFIVYLFDSLDKGVFICAVWSWTQLTLEPCCPTHSNSIRPIATQSKSPKKR